MSKKKNRQQEVECYKVVGRTVVLAIKTHGLKDKLDEAASNNDWEGFCKVCRKFEKTVLKTYKGVLT